MPKVASWIRECDERLFQRFFDPHPEMQLLNARTASVEASECAGLLITGGPDISAEFLRQPIPNPAHIEDPEPARDAWEFAALRHAIEAGKPVFAVCKGHQILNVALGGTLHLDIPGHETPESKDGNVQGLRYVEGITPQFPKVNSSHHQAIDRLGDGLVAEAWAVADGIVEQVRLANYPFALGVQFHPERDWMYAPLFEEFIGHVAREMP